MGAKNLTRDVTNAIKGIDITLMVAQHFFYFSALLGRRN